MRMKWKPFSSGVLYTCQDCPKANELQLEVDKWRLIAQRFYDAYDKEGHEFAVLSYEDAVRHDR